MKFCIVVLNWNGKEDTAKCLTSLRKLDGSCEIILVDNASTDDSVPYFRTAFPEVTILQNDRNLGFAEGNNVGIRHALCGDAEYIFLLNNDTVVAPDLLQQLEAMLRTQSNPGILGATVYRLDETDRLDHLGGKWNPERMEFDLIGKGEQMTSSPVELDYVCGAGILVKREVFQQIGLLESRFFLFWEEADFCARARNHGFSIQNCPTAHIWHKGSASFRGGKPHAAYFYWRGRLLWIEKHFPATNRWRALLQLLRKEGIRQAKLALLKSLEYAALHYILRRKNTHEKRDRMLRYCASICGIWDYALRRFDGGPLWLTRARKN